MIAICPRCGYPSDVETRLVSVRDVKCSLCSWSGSSSDLIMVEEGKYQDPRIFNALYEFLAKRMSTAVGIELLRLGLIERAETTEELQRFTQLLINYTNAGFGSLIRDLVGKPDA